MMLDKCPGTHTILMPTIKLKTCPNCGEEVEVDSTDFKTKCPACNFTIFNNVASCIEYCEYAKECVGEDLYNEFKRKQEEIKK